MHSTSVLLDDVCLNSERTICTGLKIDRRLWISLRNGMMPPVRTHTAAFNLTGHGARREVEEMSRKWSEFKGRSVHRVVQKPSEQKYNGREDTLKALKWGMPADVVSWFLMLLIWSQCTYFIFISFTPVRFRGCKKNKRTKDSHEWGLQEGGTFRIQGGPPLDSVLSACQLVDLSEI